MERAREERGRKGKKGNKRKKEKDGGGVCVTGFRRIDAPDYLKRVALTDLLQ